MLSVGKTHIRFLFLVPPSALQPHIDMCPVNTVTGVEHSSQQTSQLFPPLLSLVVFLPPAPCPQPSQAMGRGCLPGSVGPGRSWALGWWWPNGKVPAFSSQESCRLAWLLPTTVEVRCITCPPGTSSADWKREKRKPITCNLPGHGFGDCLCL